MVFVSQSVKVADFIRCEPLTERAIQKKKGLYIFNKLNTRDKKLSTMGPMDRCRMDKYKMDGYRIDKYRIDGCKMGRYRRYM